MKRMAAFCSICLAAAAQAQVPLSPVALPSDQPVPVTLDSSQRLSVPVTIGGQPWHFLMDTASTRSVIASDVADQLKLVQGKALQVLNIGGTDTVPSVEIPELGFSDFALRDIHAPALLRDNLGGDGLLGLDILHNRRVAIDFRHGATLTIAPSSAERARKPADADPDAIVVVGRSRFGELIVTDADIDGHRVAVILDTGSEESIGNPALAKVLFHDSRTPPIPTTLLSVTGRSLPANYASARRMRIGDVRIDHLPIAFADIATFRQFGLTRRPALLLGMQTLRLFAKVTIDFPRHRIQFLMNKAEV